ncbi:hypothetical protein HNQ96_004947 [Aminobacter lissarensis]|uniref:DUF982 domain-containing protein n=1 Tax=Aminobacter carboxidus TaxID=376165 RepID=A0A8E2BEH2_9HYPH|nr:DUF982 domain-containing protein [Aminobacter lissarensis]MBB6469058.1 hypothetical protein [Aminobacter lissarensis]
MGDKQFREPIFLKAGKHTVQEIACLHGAILFLEDWPEKKRDHSYEVALEASLEACRGKQTIEAARAAIVAFADGNGIREDTKTMTRWLVSDAPTPSL